MAVTNEFRNAIDSKDIRLARIMLKDSLVVDPTFAEFNQMMALAQAMDGLFDDHDGEALNYDTSVWTKDYMDEQMVQVVYNFSNERLDLLKSICKHLYRGRATKIENDRNYGQQGSKPVSRKQIGAGVATVGVISVAIGAVASQSVVIGAGVVAIIVGGVMFISER